MAIVHTDLDRETEEVIADTLKDTTVILFMFGGLALFTLFGLFVLDLVCAVKRIVF